MTKEEVLAMNPSVELGNLVATEVMKWRMEGDHWVAPEGFHVKAFGLDGWYPWRDISAAWQVIDKLKECYPLISYNHYPDGDEWEVVMYPPKTRAIEVKSKNAPEAICKAALLTKCS